MSVGELARFIGRKGRLTTKEFEVAVVVADVRTSWGQVHFLVTPVAGVGASWVDSQRVTCDPIEKEVDPFGY